MSLKLARPGCFGKYARAYKALLTKRLEIANELLYEDPVKNANRINNFMCNALSMQMSTERRRIVTLIDIIIRNQLLRTNTQPRTV